MEKKQIKKLVSALTVVSILGTSIVTPLNVVSTEAFASEVSESNLVNITKAVTTTADVFQYRDVTFNNASDLTKWGEGSSWNKIAGNSERLGEILVDSSGAKIGLSFYRAGAQQYSIYADYLMQTEIGKKYYISYDIVNTQSDTTTKKSGDHKALVRVGDAYDVVNGRYLNGNVHNFANAGGYEKTNESSGFTFTATSDFSVLNFDYSTTRTEKDDNQNQVWLTNIKVLDAESGVAIDLAKQAAGKQAVDALFNNDTPTSNAIKSTTTQQTIDDAQKLVDAIADAGVKAARQADLDKAQSLLDAKNEAAAEQAKQTAARQAVDALFNNNTPTSNAIKSTTTQKAIDDAQKLVDMITDAGVKAARQADLNKAQNLLDAKNEAAAEQAKQTAARQAVDALFNNNTPTSNAIKSTTTQKAIDDAQKLVDMITDAGVKAARQADLNKAQNLLDAKNEAAAEQAKQTAARQAVDALFNNDTPTSNAIKAATTQRAIDDAQKLVDMITDAGVKAARQADLDKAQNLLDARTAQAASDQAQKAVANYAVNQLFVSNNPTSDAIKASTDQDAIDNVQAEIDKINDTTIKAGLQTTLDRAQELLDERNATAKQVEEAKKTIDELFNNGNTNGSLKDTTNQAAIDKAQEKIDAVLDAGKKAELQKELDAAQKQLDDRNSAAEAEKDRQEKATAYVKDLFKDSDTNGSLKDTTDQVAIDKAQEAIDAVTDPTVKESLQKDLDKAKALLVSDKITNIDTHIAGTGYVKGTTSPGVTRVGLFVNGVLVKTAAASNGEFQIYAGGTPEMKIAGQIFEIAALTSTNVAGVKTASIVSPKATTKLAAPTINDFYKGEGYVTGTVPTGTVKVALYIDGMFIRYGNITGNDFKIYGYDVSHLKTHGKEFHVLVEDATGKQSDLTASTVKLKDTTVTPDDATTKSSYLTGLVLSDNANRIALYVDGEFIRHGAITKDGYRVYAYDVKALKQVGAEYEIYVLDSGNNVLTSIKETVK